MDDKQKNDFYSCIALCDQAIAPIKQLINTLDGVTSKEVKLVTDAADNGKIDKITDVRHQASYLKDAVEVLERLKLGIEKYEKQH